MNLEFIRQQRLQARKAGDRVITNLLGTLIGECDLLAKTPVLHTLSDADVLAVVRKMGKRNRETAELIRSDPRRVDQLKMLDLEQAALETLLPAQMSAAALEAVVRPLHDTNHTVTEIMTKLKTEYAGRYDPRMAIVIVKAVFSETTGQPP